MFFHETKSEQYGLYATSSISIMTTTDMCLVFMHCNKTYKENNKIFCLKGN